MRTKTIIEQSSEASFEEWVLAISQRVFAINETTPPPGANSHGFQAYLRLGQSILTDVEENAERGSNTLAFSQR